MLPLPCDRGGGDLVDSLRTRKGCPVSPRRALAVVGHAPDRQQLAPNRSALLLAGQLPCATAGRTLAAQESLPVRQELEDNARELTGLFELRKVPALIEGY